MASVGQVYYNVIDKSTGECSSSGPGIFKQSSDPKSKELVGRYGADRFTKLGVQAPPGTKMVLNLDKEIIIGATGMYELEEVPITSLYFVKPLKYTYDEPTSNGLIDKGIVDLKAAEKKRGDSMSDLAERYPTIPDRTSDPDTYKNYWSEYNTIQTTFISEYNEALRSFMQGQNGQYKLPNENNIMAPENYDDLYNVIIDFLSE